MGYLGFLAEKSKSLSDIILTGYHLENEMINDRYIEKLLFNQIF